MAQAITNEDFRQLVRLAENRERARIGASLPVARQAIARRWCISPATLENIRRGRFKELRNSIVERIGAGIVHDLETEIARLGHERHLLVQSGYGLDSCEMHEVENVLQKVREAFDALAK